MTYYSGSERKATTECVIGDRPNIPSHEVPWGGVCEAASVPPAVPSSCSQPLPGACTCEFIRAVHLLPCCYGNHAFCRPENWLVPPRIQGWASDSSAPRFSVVAAAVWFQPLADHFKHVLISAFSVKMLCVKSLLLRASHSQKTNWDRPPSALAVSISDSRCCRASVWPST